MKFLELHAGSPFKYELGKKVMGFAYGFNGSKGFICGTIVDREHHGKENAYIIESEYGKYHNGTLYETSIMPTFDEKILLRELEKDKMLTVKILFNLGTAVVVEKDEKEIFWQEIKGEDTDPDDLLETYKKLLSAIGYKPLLDELYCGDGLYVLKFEKDDENKENQKMIDANGIKQLLAKASDAEIRMMLSQAKDMDIELDDKLIVDLFKQGIVIDIIIRNADENDFLPKRLEKYYDNKNHKNNENGIFDKGFFKVKIIKTPTSNIKDSHILNPLEASGLLVEILDHDIKVASDLKGENGFVRMRFISAKKDRFLNIKEVRDTLGSVLSLDEYTFLVEDITD